MRHICLSSRRKRRRIERRPIETSLNQSARMIRADVALGSRFLIGVPLILNLEPGICNPQ